ncbi:hypothetical protein [Sphingobacterium deserti]|uniref:Uncharacterized protein n=1 Tax=Sphingobacterium deserti TaxID=1229276 RepID=A0A0B8T772_9SPHI|nr:hypothetical protein [Sphingobacterium deserti]KGE13505.1 hypothetical protein DI53_2693 [Sphingobacterium deserti]
MDTTQYRNKVNLVIERTLNGLDYDYVSAGLNRNELEKLQLSFDERNQVGQFNEGYCYSVKRTNQHVIYSVINTSMKDSANRKGFLAVRLIVKHNEYISSVMQYLLRITTQYINHIKDNSLNNQDYDLILEEAARSIKQNDGINPAIAPDKTIFYQFLNLTLDQSEAFNNPKLAYATKVYFLDEQSIHNEVVAKQFGFQSVEDLFAKIRKITFNNTTTNGLRVKINEQEISLSKDQFVLCRADDRIQYKLTFDTRYKEVSIFEGEVEVRPEEIILPHRSAKEPKRNSTAVIWAWIIGPLLGIAIGFWGIDFAVDWFGIENKQQQDDLVLEVEQADNFSFKIDTSKNNMLQLFFVDSLVSEYIFIYNGKAEGWKFYKSGGEKNAEQLTRTKLRAIFKEDSTRVERFRDHLIGWVPSEIPNEPTQKTQPDSRPATNIDNIALRTKTKLTTVRNSSRSTADDTARSAEKK